MNYDEYESEFYDHSLDPYNTYEEYLDSHITKEDLMYLGDIELARQLKEEVPIHLLRGTIPKLKYSLETSSSPKKEPSKKLSSASPKTKLNHWPQPHPNASAILSWICSPKEKKRYLMEGG